MPWDAASQSFVIAPRADLHFFHQATQQVPADLTAYEAYCQMTGQPSYFLRLAFWLRDRLSALGGVTAIRGFGEKNPGQPPSKGDKLDFFRVEGLAADTLLLTSRDRHLSVLLALGLSQTSPGEKTLRITTSVLTHNFFGKVYMLPVGLAHGPIVQNSLKKIATP
ncbi:DUF2867 domain-containing protein [Rhodovibrionaceae bacterium A322]